MLVELGEKSKSLRVLIHGNIVAGYTPSQDLAELKLGQIVRTCDCRVGAGNAKKLSSLQSSAESSGASSR